MEATKKKAVNGRNKGAAFERQIANEIKAVTGLECKRLIEQYRKGCLPGDLEGAAVEGYAIECKRYARIQPALLAKWRAQALAQAGGPHEPVLIYKADRQPIVVNRWTDKTDPSSVWEQSLLDFLFELKHNASHRQH
jgi:hypothetical protein|nr:MAG TPA: HOLLIDAY JUNCTION RESOLVASE HOMOLOGOUS RECOMBINATION [Caudoviricetes sp.]